MNWHIKQHHGKLKEELSSLCRPLWFEVLLKPLWWTHSCYILMELISSREHFSFRSHLIFLFITFFKPLSHIQERLLQCFLLKVPLFTSQVTRGLMPYSTRDINQQKSTNNLCSIYLLDREKSEMREVTSGDKCRSHYSVDFHNPQAKGRETSGGGFQRQSE